VIDTRLHNTSQLSGFAKSEDLRYFLKELHVGEYVHQPLLAPTEEMLDAYKKKRIGWEEYAQEFNDLMRTRHIEDALDKSQLDRGCLLCSEDTPHYCHRRLVAEYLREAWGSSVEISHIV
jgi:uncharacterized protein YeaO (DUF488 family)